MSRWFPDPPDNGARLRAWGQLRALSQQHEVTLVSFAQPGQAGEPSEALRSMCRRVIVLPYRPYRPHGWRARAGLFAPWPRSLIDTHSPEMRRTLEQEARSGGHDAVLAASFDMSAYVEAFADLPAVIDDLEIGSYLDRLRRGSALARARQRLTFAKVVHYLRRVLPRFRAAIAASDVEAAQLRRVVPDYDRFTVIENAVDTRACALLRRSDAVPPRLVFAGALTYEPNLDAMRWFCSRILPRVRADRPDLRLTITGESRGSGFAAPDGVDMVGRVEDARPVVAAAAVSIAPIRMGGGTRLKILEAMALGTPVVSTSKAAEGLAAVHGEHLLLADDAVVFAAHVLRLLGDAELRRHLTRAACALVESRYDVAVTGRLLVSLVDRILDEGGRHRGAGI